MDQSYEIKLPPAPPVSFSPVVITVPSEQKTTSLKRSSLNSIPVEINMLRIDEGLKKFLVVTQPQLYLAEASPVNLPIPYSKIRPVLRPFDLVAFRGTDCVSGCIRCLELNRPCGGRIRSGDFSHVGMIVTSDILDDVRCVPGKLYIWESTMSGKLADGVNNVNGQQFLGVQLRDFDQVVSEPIYILDA